jgi:hypothetical protein
MQLFLTPQSGHTLSFIFVVIYRVHFVYSYDHQVMSVAVHDMVCKFIKQQVLHDTWRLTCDHERMLGRMHWDGGDGPGCANAKNSMG